MVMPNAKKKINKNNQLGKQDSLLIVRNATLEDVPAMAALSARVYQGTGITPISAAMITGGIALVSVYMKNVRPW